MEICYHLTPSIDPDFLDRPKILEPEIGLSSTLYGLCVVREADSDDDAEEPCATCGSPMQNGLCANGRCQFYATKTHPF